MLVQLMQQKLHQWPQRNVSSRVKGHHSYRKVRAPRLGRRGGIFTNVLYGASVCNNCNNLWNSTWLIRRSNESASLVTKPPDSRRTDGGVPQIPKPCQEHWVQWLSFPAVSLKGIMQALSMRSLRQRRNLEDQDGMNGLVGAVRLCTSSEYLFLNNLNAIPGAKACNGSDLLISLHKMLGLTSSLVHRAR